MAINAKMEPKAGDAVTPSPATSNKPVVCVFCGASGGNSPAHLAAARELAQALHENNMKLVYGGGTVGIMGEVAKTLVSLAGPDAVHGIIPEALVKYERDYKEGAPLDSVIDESTFGRTTVVADMHSRKQAMAREVIDGGEGGGFVALSGGYGTMEELMEVTTWNQLGIHARGVIVFNVEGYYDGLLQWVRTAVKSGFIANNNSNIMIEAKTGVECVESLKNYQNAEGRMKLEWNQK
ncbi:lysine decarboxylase-like protein-like protein [Aureobasidium pullulans]|uniref:Lysine decarboxylase-like protein-like protein n=1 Tax=Aureobasidium pullulans TaxID=5580 RepID=A0A4S9Q3F7_AURPU|nr:lysine decarboxylase-like protein-like protein [Aureobasidium pullulans]THX93668.1 lysine decarboxylase-like protein-like protein [Aureobasidium pullulans]THY77667.1 lysine decarboxylase-like protein-like protein [Aureobasidium pullulans]THZ41014.1 lysine decarboxylase-like protein-like protein [Aureobasidium pullulans]THZ67667.1 lysine decarboxylase-like protein-like protein [Aureobasidium pullulans]